MKSLTTILIAVFVIALSGCQDTNRPQSGQSVMVEQELRESRDQNKKMAALAQNLSAQLRQSAQQIDALEQQVKAAQEQTALLQKQHEALAGDYAGGGVDDQAPAGKEEVGENQLVQSPEGINGALF